MVKSTTTDNSVTRQLTLASGVVLNLKRVSSVLFADLMRRYPRPKVPRWLNPDTDREEDNPDNPDYIQAIADWNNNMSMITIDNMILMGTEISSTPEGFIDFMSEEWVDLLEAGGQIIGKNKAKRYLAYIKYVACAGSDEDISSIAESIGKLTGVSEKDVDNTVNRFRSDNGRNTDNVDKS